MGATDPSDATSDVFERIEAKLRAGPSRRGFLRGAVATSAVLGVGAGAAAAQDDDQTGDPDASTVDTLDYLLRVEQVSNACYTRGLVEFDESDVETAELADRVGDEPSVTVHEYLTYARNQERAHADVLWTAIDELGGDPATGLDFEFGFDSVDDFLATAQRLETVGVSAYAGALAGIDHDAVRTLAAMIATVEGRHAAYLDLVNGDPPFPEAVGEALPREAVTEVVDEFVVRDE